MRQSTAHARTQTSASRWFLSRPVFFCVSVVILIAHSSVASLAAESHDVDFAREILPILSDKCFACHGPDTQDEDELRLDSFETATADRGGYRAIDPQDPGASVMLERIFSTDDPMPPEDADKQLTDAERAKLKQWIHQGAKYAKHWAFVPPRRDYELNSIDAYIKKELDRNNVDFAPEADKRTLARRVSLVLTGLPPEPEQLEAYLADSSQNAYEELVDSLLASPRYGEHQARYWLDAVRYGDTHGLHLDNRRGIYPYRDWVVRAMNENLPLDQFITWQLAGDLLPDPSLEQLTATGYVRMNPTTSEGGVIPAEFQAKNNFDRVENMGTVLLGMTFICARCHTHKYDPVTHTEYYQLMAFFHSTAENALDGNRYEYGPTIKVPQDQAGWTAHREWVAQRDAIFQEAMDIHRDKCADENWTQASVDERLRLIADPFGSFADTDVSQAAFDLMAKKKTLEESFTTTLVAKELDKPRPTFLLRRGEYNLPQGDPLEPEVPSVLGSLPEGTPKNRLGLAQWLTSDEHPLVARVLVNRIWQRVFGHALVRSPEDFGVQGQYPTHPELLDWLAVELQQSEWNLKRLLRRMVTSKTFRQSSRWRSDLDDPENLLWARASSYRLDAEVLRDIGLWSSQLLDPQMGGEGVKPYQPNGMWLAMAHPASNTKKYERDSGEKLYRRSLYVYWKRTSPHPMMTIFDAPDREASCVRRSRTNTSLQSLGLLNETQRIEMSRKLAERLLREADSDDARLNRLFRLLACRSPSEKESQACLQVLASAKERYADAKDDAEALVSIGDVSRDESFDVSELAAWTQVTSIVLASDVALVLY